jgi:hypothetical protein
VWGWIKPLLLAIFGFLWSKRNEPKQTIENANTPKPIADANTARYHEWLRRVQGSDKSDGH